MQLIENKQTRLQLWSRQARATRWGVSCIFPPADRPEEDILVAEANYTISYDAMIRVHYALGFGAVDELPDYGVLTREKTLLKYQRYLQLKEKKAVGKGYNKENLVFCTSTGKPAPPRSFTRNFQGALKHAGLERMRFHDMRHTVATVLLEEGAALNTVQELLGHYDPKFTATQYGHVTTRMRTEATDKLSGLLTAAKRVGQHDTKKS